MSEPIPIRIVYGNTFDFARAESLGGDAAGNQLYRVWRRRDVSGRPERVDVLLLRLSHDNVFEFVGVADPARSAISHLRVAGDCLGKPGYEAFHRRLSESGAVVEHEYHGIGPIDLVVSHSPDTPVAAWHAEMLRETIGVAAEELPEYVAQRREDASRRDREERSRAARARRSERTKRALSSFGSSIVSLGVVLVIVGGPALLLVQGEALDRPRLSALAILAMLVPMAIVAGLKQMWPLVAGTAAVGLGALSLLSGDAPAYGTVTALGAVYALLAGVGGVVLAFLSLFSHRTRELVQMWLGLVLPLVGSSIAAGVMAVSAAAGAGSRSGFPAGMKTIAIGVTAVVLLAPVLVLVSNGFAVLKSGIWRERPGLMLAVLATMPLSLLKSMLPALLKLGVILGIVWGVVWLVGR
jgi:hypothetical protein